MKQLKEKAVVMAVYSLVGLIASGIADYIHDKQTMMAVDERIDERFAEFKKEQEGS